MMKIICAKTKARKRRTPMMATEPGVRKLFEEFASTELMRPVLAGRIVFDLIFFALILRGIIQTLALKNFPCLLLQIYFAKLKPISNACRNVEFL
tara:strand:- start:102 stop:386 length:285 start_codon:yes stop_codon:yes gene_type:complete